MGSLMTQVRYLAFLAVVAAVVEFTGQDLFASPPPPICSEVCSASACDETCYVDMMEFENGNDITCLDYGSWDGSACCGDGACEGDEGGNQEMDACAVDCPDTVTTCGECSVSEQDCGGNAVCVTGGCCVLPCEGSECGQHQRTCQGPDSCVDSSECCADEICLRDVFVDAEPVPYFMLVTPQCVPWPYGT